MKRQILLVTSLLLLSFSTMARMHSEPDNSSVVDSIKMNRMASNHIMINDSVVNFGKLFLNTPYHYGSPGISSFDCSGFTSHVYRNFGYDLGRSSNDQAKQFDSIDRTQLKAGDLVFFSGSRRSKRVGHVGIVTDAKDNGEFDFIHAAVHSGVTISNSTEEYYTRRFVKASRVIGVSQLLAISRFVSKNDKIQKDIPNTTAALSHTQTVEKIIPAEYYRVKPGETLSSISKKSGMTVAQLKRKNKLKGNKLSLNQKLMIKDEETVLVAQAVESPANKTNSSAENNSKKALTSKSEQVLATNQSDNIHLVKKGESLFSIANSYHISVAELKKMNDIAKEKIKPGQQLKIHQSVETVSPESYAKAEQTSKPTNHKVMSGESLFSISKSIGIPVEELMKMNNLSSAKIHPGQELKLNQEQEIKNRNEFASITDSKQKGNNENKEKAFTHKIKKGENLGAIAKENNTTVDELKKINNLTDTKIHEGQVIKIIPTNESNPQYNLTEREDKKKEGQTGRTEVVLTHKIKEGESLGSIAKNNNTTVNELKRINHLTDTKIKPGQELKLSNSVVSGSKLKTFTDTDSKSIQHKVKSGESFYTIAKLYGCTVEELKDWNSKSGSKIKVGEKIIVFQKSSKKDLSLVE